MPLDEAPESQSVEYLCDYLYVDTSRLAHYYSQLSEHGLITQAKHSSKSSGQEDSTLQLGIPLLGGKIKQGKSAEETVEMQIDPAFRRPQETLDALYAHGFLRKGMGHLGELCLIEGLISIVDLRMMREMWSYMGGFIAEANTAAITNPKQKQKQKQAEVKSYNEMAEILKRLPHALQGSVASLDGVGWFTLKPEYMLVNPEDLMFKTGVDIPGTWQVVFIVDAYPDHIYNNDHSELFNETIEEGIRTMVRGMRESFGRPPERYGITPIMIFRTIKRPTYNDTIDKAVQAEDPLGAETADS